MENSGIAINFKLLFSPSLLLSWILCSVLSGVLTQGVNCWEDGEKQPGSAGGSSPALLEDTGWHREVWDMGRAPGMMLMALLPSWQ